MRKLMWFAIGFCAAIAVGAYLLMGNTLALLGIICAAVAVLASFAVRKHRWVRIPVAILVGLALGFAWFWIYDGGYLSPARELDGMTAEAAIEMIDYSFDNDYGVAADGNAKWNGRTYRIRLYLHEKHMINPGDLVTGTFQFRITDKGGSKEPTFHRGNGIQLLAYQYGEIEIDRKDAPWWHYPVASLRQSMLTMIARLFPQDTEAFARALLLGDDSDIGYELNTAFKATGIRHIIAVSGLHVSILFGFIYLITARKRLLTTLVGIPLVVLFAAVAGFTPSVVRASIMHILMVLALLFDREYDAPTALSFAGVAILIMEPLAVTSVGFQLSFGCVGGILLFSMPIRNWLMADHRLGRYKKKPFIGKMVRGFAASLSTSLGAVSLTTPLCAYYFGCVSLISPLTNLLTLWMVTFVFYGIMAACAAGAVSFAAGQTVAWVVSWGIRYIVELCKLLSKIPLAAVYTQSQAVVIWLVFLYLLLTLFVILRQKKPALTISFAVFGLCAALLADWIPPMTDTCRMTVLDVGQGQSIILQSEGRTFLVDCGGSYADDAADMAAEKLLSMGISRIDGLILTHYDSDHAGGAEQFLTRIQADLLLLPPWDEDPCLSSREQTILVDKDLLLEYDTSKLTIFTSESKDSGNESSLCVLFQAGNCDILITGDRSASGERALLKKTQLPQLEVLVAGHHGSKHATCQELLNATKPQVVVISAGENNSYGHPAQELLNRLEELGCIIFRTDQDGTITIRR